MSRALSLLLAACLVCGISPLAAQEATPEGAAVQAPLPSWVVLVLQPIAGERVRPVTGVVVSSEGLILVPTEFAAPGDTLIVLDGGSDIIANGRAAFVKSEHPEFGLDVLTAPLLRRTPAPLSAVPLEAGTELRLGAFPPAEQIAAGAPPTWRTVALGAGSTDSSYVLAAGAGLPQVSGPLMDACGYLLGFHVAPVVQSLEAAANPAITGKAALMRLLESVPVTLRETPCNPAAPLVPADSPAESLSPSTSIAEEAAPATNPPESAAVGAQAPTTSADAGSASTDTAALPVKPWSSSTFWSALLGVTAIVLLGWLWVRRKSAVKVEEASVIAPRDRRGAVEVVWTGRRNQPAGPGAATSDSRLEITGKLADGKDFTAGCAVNGAAFSVIVGRGKVDIVIDHASIHREHLALGGSRDHMTVSDLGSASGTWVNRVPCLPGEIFFVGEGDTVFAGDVSFTVAVKPLPHANAGSNP